MAFIRKLKGSLVRQDVDEYVGESTYLFYDIVSGSIRIWDGTPGGMPIAKPLSELTDVTITSPATAQVLTYSASGWVNAVPASGSTILTTIIKATDYTLDVLDDVILVTGVTTITLPLASTITGKVFHIKNAGGIVTVNTTASETIDDQPAIVISELYTSITVVSDGVKWHII